MAGYDLHLKRAYEPPAAADGTRILVDRVWPRGVRKEDLQADVWLRDAAPSTALRKWFGHDPERWPEFQRRYHAELRERPQVLEELRDALAQGRVTLVYGARDEQHNQAVALRDFLTRAR